MPEKYDASPGPYNFYQFHIQLPVQFLRVEFAENGIEMIIRVYAIRTHYMLMPSPREDIYR